MYGKRKEPCNNDVNITYAKLYQVLHDFETESSAHFIECLETTNPEGHIGVCFLEKLQETFDECIFKMKENIGKYEKNYQAFRGLVSKIESIVKENFRDCTIFSQHKDASEYYEICTITFGEKSAIISIFLSDSNNEIIISDGKENESFEIFKFELSFRQEIKIIDTVNELLNKM